HRLESVTRAWTAKSGAHDDRSAFGCTAGGERREGTLHHLERHGHTSGRVDAVEAHHVVERERDCPPAFFDGQRLGHRSTITGGSCAPVQPRASRDVPTSSVSTLGLPCTHIASGSAGSAGSYHAPVDSCTTS